jgi:hypothetical protein
MLHSKQSVPPAGDAEIGVVRGSKAPLNPLFMLLILLTLVLSGCEGPKPRQAGVICLNLTFSVAIYSWLIISLVSLVYRKLRRDSMAIPQRLLLYQLGVAIVVSAGLSSVLFSIPFDTYLVFSRTPLVEWRSLQLYSFLFLPFIVAYVLLAYLITLLPSMRKLRPYTLSVAVIIHWLYCAHYFVVR